MMTRACLLALCAARLSLGQEGDKPEKVEIGRPAPPFGLTDARGRRHVLLDFRRPTLFVFFSAGSASCRRALPALARLEASLRKNGWLLVWIDVTPGRGAEERVYRRHSAALILRDGEQQVARLYGVNALPTAMLVDGGGVLRSLGRSSEDLRNAFRALPGGERIVPPWPDGDADALPR